MKQRLDWVDYARGIGIILVVFAHNLGGQSVSGIPLPGPLAGLISYAYSFHMPLFFFLSGLFVEHSYRKGLAPFLQSKVRTILYPFVIWSLILGMTQRVMGAYVNHPYPQDYNPLLFLILPVEQMWFLQALFSMLIFYAVMQKIGLKSLPFFLICAGLTLFVLPFVHDETVGRGLFHLIYFGAGVWLHGGVNKCILSAKTGSLLAVSIAALCAQLFLVFGLPRSQTSMLGTNMPVRVIIALFGVLSVCTFSEVINRTQKVQWLRVVGQYTMPILLMHTIFGSGARIVLLRFLHLQSPYLHEVLELATGVCVPMAIGFALDRWNATWVFEWPMSRRVGAAQ